MLGVFNSEGKYYCKFKIKQGTEDILNRYELFVDEVSTKDSHGVTFVSSYYHALENFIDRGFLKWTDKVLFC